MIAVIFLAVLIVFYLAYKYYGGFLNRTFDIDDDKTTPSHTDYDGVDRVPTKTMVLFGHHFSSIAGAGPIVGPIIAAAAFGWLPAILWIVIGSIFIGGLQDFSSLIASVRHKAKSIAEIAHEYMSPLSYRLFLIFIWLTMIYVLIVFIDLTATSFVAHPEVATSSSFFIFLAVLMGFSLYRLKVPLLWASLIFIPLIFAGIWIGHIYPLGQNVLPEFFTEHPGRAWSIILIIYAFIAASAPVWILLQPRDYLSSFLLYSTILAAFLGILLGGFSLEYPAFTTWADIDRGTLFPILFITIACGAISGFHSIVASGTTSKQLDRETDARKIGYGGMLIEGLVAVIALFTVVILVKGDPILSKAPLLVFGAGLGNFLSKLGVPYTMGESFGILAVSTFLLTTLDTSTRLGRYILEEFVDIKGKYVRFVSTAATLAIPLLFTFITLYDSQGNPTPIWKAVWPVFGSTNQLLAGLALLVVYVWRKKQGKSAQFIFIPMVFMLIMTLWALGQLIYQAGFTTIGIIAFILLVLAIILVYEAFRTIFLTGKIVAKD